MGGLELGDSHLIKRSNASTITSSTSIFSQLHTLCQRHQHSKLIRARPRTLLGSLPVGTICPMLPQSVARPNPWKVLNRQQRHPALMGRKWTWIATLVLPLVSARSFFCIVKHGRRALMPSAYRHFTHDFLYKSCTPGR